MLQNVLCGVYSEMSALDADMIGTIRHSNRLREHFDRYVRQKDTYEVVVGRHEREMCSTLFS